MLILYFDYPEGLIGTKCDEEEVQYEFPGKAVEPNILFEGTQSYFFYKVHFDDALSIFLHW